MSSPILFSLFINDLISYLRSQCDWGIFVSNQIQDLLALLCADDVASNKLIAFKGSVSL